MSEQTHYENEALWSAERFLTNASELKRFTTCAQMIPVSAGSLLDVGSGNGAFFRFLEERGTQLDLFGIERSQKAIAMKVCAAPIRPGSVDDLPVQAQSYDVVSALEVLEHLPVGVYERALSGMERAAAHYILISVPCREQRHNIRCPYCGCAFNKNYHVRSFNDAALERLFQGFRLETCQTVTYREYVVMPLVRYLRRLRPASADHFPPTTLCPQCNYQQEAAPQVTPAAPPKAPIPWIPLWQRPVWYVALYRRSGVVVK
jgi:SAM-dependent methyltransferase